MTDAQKWINALQVINRFRHESIGFGFFIYEKEFILDKDDLRKIDPEALKILEDSDWVWDGSVIQPRG